MMNALNLCVLAGGFGTRLRSAVANVPKPLAPVAGRPCLDYLIERWVEQRVTSLTLLLHHEAALIESYLESQSNAGRWSSCAIRTVVEDSPLGTGGAVANAVRCGALQGSFLVANADTWLGGGVAQIAAAPAPAIAVVHVKNCERYGAVGLSDGKVIEFTEKQQSSGAGWINAGLYRLDASLFEQWRGQAFSLERELFPALVGRGLLHATVLETTFIDIGVPDDYHRFCRWIESGREAAP